MAKVINGNIIGNVGNLNYYMKNGVNMVRKRRAKNNKPSTGGQLVNQEKFKMANRFLNPLVEFVKTGYADVSRSKLTSPQNLVISEITKGAIFGVMPDLYLDFEKIKVCNGVLRAPWNAKVRLLDGELQFTWDVLNYGWPVASERVMLLAYAPECDEAIYNLAGAQHQDGKDVLKLDLSWKGLKIETYMAFRAENGLQVSDSVYTGSILFDL